MFVSIEVRLAAAQMKYDFKVKLQTFLSESHAQMLKVKMRKTVEQNKYVMKRLDTREYDAITKEIEACTLHVRFLMNQMIQVNREVQAMECELVDLRNQLQRNLRLRRLHLQELPAFLRLEFHPRFACLCFLPDSSIYVDQKNVDQKNRM